MAEDHSLVAGLVEVEVGLRSYDLDQNDPSSHGPPSNDLGLTGRAESDSGLNGPVTSDADLSGRGAIGPALRDLDVGHRRERVFLREIIWERVSSQSLPPGRDICP